MTSRRVLRQVQESKVPKWVLATILIVSFPFAVGWALVTFCIPLLIFSSPLDSSSFGLLFWTLVLALGWWSYFGYIAELFGNKGQPTLRWAVSTTAWGLSGLGGILAQSPVFAALTAFNFILSVIATSYASGWLKR